MSGRLVPGMPGGIAHGHVHRGAALYRRRCGGRFRRRKDCTRPVSATLIARQAAIYRVDPDLVWSIIYEETYFSPWKNGKDGEVGLMQITPAVGREWAAETGMHDLERQMSQNPTGLLRDPERNIQIACWYLEKAGDNYPDLPGREARMLAAYNAGPSRAADWNRVESGARPLNEQEFIARIDIASTRAYVTSILGRYRRVKSAAPNFRL